MPPTKTRTRIPPPTLKKGNQKAVALDDNDNEATFDLSSYESDVETENLKTMYKDVAQNYRRLRCKYNRLKKQHAALVKDNSNLRRKLLDQEAQEETRSASDSRSDAVAVASPPKQQVKAEAEISAENTDESEPINVEAKQQVEGWPYEETPTNKVAMIAEKKDLFAMYKMENKRERLLIDGKTIRSKIFQQVLPSFFDFNCRCGNCKEKMKQERISKSWVSFSHFAKWKGSSKIMIGTEIMCALCKEENNDSPVIVVKHTDGPEMLVHIVETEHSKVYFKTVKPREVITQEQLLQLVSPPINSDDSHSDSDSTADSSLNL